MYRTIRIILRYDTIHKICILYSTIHEHLRYADTIRIFFHMIQYISYDTYHVLYDTDNYTFQYYLWVLLYYFNLLLFLSIVLSTNFFNFSKISRSQTDPQNESKGMFSNYFFSLFSVSKINFLFLRLKNLFDNPK